MNNHSNNTSDSHQEIAKLLPWYVNKSLKGQELETLELHLGTCLTCNRELMQIKKLAQAIRHDTSFNSAENASFARLKKRIHANQNSALSENAFAFDKQRAGRTLSHGHTPSRLKVSSWAIAAMLLLALVMPLNFTNTGSLIALNQYKTLSDGQSEKLKANEIRVVFAENINEGDKTRIIAAINGHFIGKPSLQGVYTVNLPDAMTQSGILSTIGQLRKDNRVIFAEPAYALLSNSSGEIK